MSLNDYYYFLAILFTVVQCNITTQQLSFCTYASQQNCSSQLCFISERQAGPEAATASQALPIRLKLRAMLCCVYIGIVILIDVFFCFLVHQDVISLSFL